MSSDTTKSYADAVKSPQRTPKQADQGASSNNGGRPADPAPLTLPFYNTANGDQTVAVRHEESASGPLQETKAAVDETVVNETTHEKSCFSDEVRPSPQPIQHTSRVLLPVELFGSVVRWLPRSYLDSIQTSNSYIMRVIANASEPRDTKTAPRRQVGLEVETAPDGTFEISFHLYTDEDHPDSLPDEVVCNSAEGFITTAANCCVSFLRMGVDQLPTDLFNILIQEAHRWRLCGVIERLPRTFPNKDDFHRFFNELAVTLGKLTLTIPENLPFTIDAPSFWNLEAVRHCQWLIVDRIAPQMEPPFSAANTLRWLEIPPSSLPCKHLYIHEGMLTEPLEQFCDSIRTDFMNASVPKTFEIRVRLRTRPPWMFYKPMDNDIGERLFVLTELKHGGYLELMRGDKSLCKPRVV